MTSPSLTPNNRELLACVRAWAAVNYPGCPVEFLAIHLRYLPVPVQLAAGLEPSASSREEADERPPVSTATGQLDERGHAPSPCLLDILRALREVGRPLTKSRLLEEMSKRGMDWSERSVCAYLKNLMEDGTIENPPDAKPRGYRLADENETSGD